MAWNRYGVPLLLAAIALSAALAQTPSTQPPVHSKSSAQGNHTPTTAPPLSAPGTPAGTGTGTPVGTVPGTRPIAHGTTPTNRREPCWQVAGVSKSVMEQRRTIAQQTRQEVEAVCANSSLSAAQKQQRIREIHQQRRQEMEGLISPAQREAMKACQQQRSGGVHAHGGHLGGGHHAGPCGSVPGIANHQNDEEPEEANPKD